MSQLDPQGMGKGAPRPIDEADRLAALRSLDVLDTPPEEPFDALVRAASLVCEAPIALLTLVDEERQWFKAGVGLPAPRETPREEAFCAHTILGEDLLEVPDAAADERFHDNPLVTRDPRIRFYAGVPVTSAGHRCGTLCVIDTVPRRLNAKQRDILRCLGVAAGQALDLRRLALMRQVERQETGTDVSACDEADFLRTALFSHAIAHATSDLIAFWDSDLRCRFANKAYKEWFGLSSREILGRPMSEVIGPALFALNRPHVDRALAGETQEFERAITRSDGSVSDTLSKYVPHLGEGGRVDGFYVSVVDITSLKQTSLRLGEAEAKFRALSEGSPHGVFHGDASGTCTYVNDRFVEIFGLPSRAGPIPSWQDLVVDEDRPRLLATWEAAEREPREIDVEARIRRADGQVRRVRLRARPLGEAGSPTPSFVGSVEDVTEREAALKRLAESEARYRLLSDASSDMIQHLDVAGRRIYVSPAAVEIYGRAPADLLGTHPADFSHPDDASRLRGLIDEIVSGRQDRARSIHRIQQEAGRWIWVESQFRLVRDPDTLECREIVSSVRDITERETLNRQLAEANQNLNLAEAVARVGHWKLDVGSGGLVWSDEVFAIHGLDRARFVPTTAEAIAAYHPEDRAEVERLVASAIERHEEFQCTLRIIRPGGEIRHVASRGLCDVDEATGRLRSVFGVVMDVTELVEAERAVRDKSALLETTLDNMDQAVVKVAADGTIELANRRFAELLDLPRQVLDNRPANFEDVLAHLHLAGEFADKDADFQRRVTAHGAPLRLGTFERARPNGTVLEIRTVPTADGAVIRTYADITARRRAESAMRESEARYRILAETTNDVISRVNLAFKRDYVSGACRRVLGFEPEELIGLRPSDSIHPDEAPAVRSLAARLVAGEIEGDRAVATYRTRHKEGHWVWVETGMNLLRDEATGAPRYIAAILRDVTERQRTALHLEQARAAAEQAAVAKAEFLANMSHELRTPLTGILGVHDLLGHQGTLDAEQRRLLALASDAGRSLLAIVNDILDVSKIDAGELRLESAPVALRPLVESCHRLAAETAAGHEVAFACRISPDVPRRLVGDATRLRQVLLNLLTNAGKFTERGSVTLAVGYEAATSTVRFDVADTGIGIPADKLPVIFERFSQADTSTTRRFGGSGLGLAISKRLVELMGGRIGVASEIGQGSTFWFEVPMAVEVGDEGAVASSPDGAAAGRRILLAEDNAMSREIVTAILTHRNYRVASVVDGAAAVDAVRRGETYDLILMDLQMPVMDGLAAAADIRRLEAAAKRPPVPIIGLTASAMTEDAARCRASGMDAHVAKPIAWPDLFHAMERLITPIPLSPPGAGAAPAVADEARLEELHAILGPRRLAEMLHKFARDLERRVALLGRCGAARLGDEAHSIAGLAGQMGFSALARLCGAIEREVRASGDSARAEDLCQALRAAAGTARTCRFAGGAREVQRPEAAMDPRP